MTALGVLPNISTNRLTIKLAGRKDRDAVIDFYKRNEGHLAPFSPTWPKDFYSPGFWDHQIQRNIDEYYSDISARFFVFPNSGPSKVIGNVSLSNVVRNAAQFCFLGYNFDEQLQGQGFGTEAVKAVVEFGFTQMKLHRIMANYIPTNERSGRLLKRVGFHVEGYARDYLFLGGKWQDHIMTAMVNPDW